MSRFHNRDYALVQQVIAGHTPAASELFERLRRVVAASVRRQSTALALEDDAVQGFYLMLVERDFHVLRSYQGRAALTTWAHPIAKRYVLRLLEKARKLPVHDAAEVEEALGTDCNLEDGVILDSESRRLRQVMVGLEADERLLLALLYEQELPVKEVAKVFGMSSPGVRMWHMRLRRRLRKAMEAE